MADQDAFDPTHALDGWRVPPSEPPDLRLSSLRHADAGPDRAGGRLPSVSPEPDAFDPTHVLDGWRAPAPEPVDLQLRSLSHADSAGLDRDKMARLKARGYEMVDVEDVEVPDLPPPRPALEAPVLDASPPLPACFEEAMVLEDETPAPAVEPEPQVEAMRLFEGPSAESEPLRPEPADLHEAPLSAAEPQAAVASVESADEEEAPQADIDDAILPAEPDAAAVAGLLFEPAAPAAAEESMPIEAPPSGAREVAAPPTEGSWVAAEPDPPPQEDEAPAQPEDAIQDIQAALSHPAEPDAPPAVMEAVGPDAQDGLGPVELDPQPEALLPEVLAQAQEPPAPVEPEPLAEAVEPTEVLAQPEAVVQAALPEPAEPESLPEAPPHDIPAAVPERVEPSVPSALEDVLVAEEPPPDTVEPALPGALAEPQPPVPDVQAVEPESSPAVEDAAPIEELPPGQPASEPWVEDVERSDASGLEAQAAPPAPIEPEVRPPADVEAPLLDFHAAPPPVAFEVPVLDFHLGPPPEAPDPQHVIEALDLHVAPPTPADVDVPVLDIATLTPQVEADPRLLAHWQPRAWMALARQVADASAEVLQSPGGLQVMNRAPQWLCAAWPPQRPDAPWLGRWPELAALVEAESRDGALQALLGELPAEADLWAAELEPDWGLVAELVLQQDAGLRPAQARALSALAEAERSASQARLNDGYLAQGRVARRRP